MENLQSTGRRAKRALVSVSDKTGVLDFAGALCELGYEILSTGGTQKYLSEGGVPVTAVEAATGFRECLDGRVKTLHPAVHGGILARRDLPAHMSSLDALGIGPIDVVAVNLYPFRQTVLKPGVAMEEAIENIDIGGPAMLRSAAKNYRFVSPVADPADYPAVIAEIREAGAVSEATNLRLALKVFEHTAQYDALIAGYLRSAAGPGAPAFPDALTLTYEKAQDLRYGENPHQRAAFYREILPDAQSAGFLASARQLHGKELSFNNIADANGALELLKEFSEPTVVACKHANPCGVGSGADIAAAYKKAYDADPVSIYGGIIATNREIGADAAREINKLFVEILIAPGFTDEALQILRTKKNIRLLRLDGLGRARPRHAADGALDLKKVSGGLLVSTPDDILLPDAPLSCVTDRAPGEKETEDMLFAWKIVKYVKSNGIAIAKGGQSLGIGCGQVNRVWAVKQAAEHCRQMLGGDALRGAALASDAFFPFPDCVEEAHDAGVTAVIQPGGSVNDQDSIHACNRYGMAMVFTGMRHFRH